MGKGALVEMTSAYIHRHRKLYIAILCYIAVSTVWIQYMLIDFDISIGN